MTESEKEIVAINEAARAKGMNYGYFVFRATKEEIEEAKRKYWPRAKKKEK